MSQLKTVSIIIPFYGQNESQLAVPLSSINNQLTVDFSSFDVHLINDGGKPVDIGLLRQFFPKLDLHYHQLKKNVGAGLARQYGIDHSESDYLMFVDADDQLYQENSLSFFFEAVKNDGTHDLFSSYYNREGLEPGNTGNIIYTQGIFDFSAVFARWLNRKFLENHKLQFSSELRSFEDFYLLGLITKLTNDHLRIDRITYLSHYRADSLTHAKKFVATGEFVRQWRLQLTYLRDNGYQVQLQQQFEELLLYIYLYHAKFRPSGVDEKVFQAEKRRLLTEFPQLRQPYSFQLQQYVNQRSMDSKDYYYGIATNDLKSFLET